MRIERSIAPTFRLIASVAIALLAVPSVALAQLNTQHVKGSAGLKSGSQGPPGGYLVAPFLYFYSADEVRTKDGDLLPFDASLNASPQGRVDRGALVLHHDQVDRRPDCWHSWSSHQGKEPRLCDRSGCNARNRPPQHRLRIRARVLSVGNLRANDDTRRRLEHLGDVAAQADQSADAVGWRGPQAGRRSAS